MTFRHYREATCGEFIGWLKDELELDLKRYQEEKILSNYYFQNRWMKVIKHIDQPKGTFTGRLLLPLISMFAFFCAIVICPLKYLFTGTYYFSDRSRIAKFTNKCYHNAGINY